MEKFAAGRVSDRRESNNRFKFTFLVLLIASGALAWANAVQASIAQARPSATAAELIWAGQAKTPRSPSLRLKAIAATKPLPLGLGPALLNSFRSLESGSRVDYPVVQLCRTYTGYLVAASVMQSRMRLRG